MITPSDFATHFIDRFEASKTIEELDIIAREIKEWRDLLATYYTSNRDRILHPFNPEDILKKKL